MEINFSHIKKENKDFQKEVVSKDIFPVLSRKVKNILENLPQEKLSLLEELRLRKNKPLAIKDCEGDFFLSPTGKRILDPNKAYKVSESDLNETLQIISQGSIYALEQEFKNGYLTIKGGHRIGFTGEAVVENGRIKTLKNIGSLNIRIAREFPGCADKVMPYIIENKRVQHTLIVSPPGCGKTTLLRDIIRQISEGVPSLKFSGVTVGVVDERSEIAGSVNGIPQHFVGCRTDVLDKSPKPEGMLMLIRSMAPSVIATDELGTGEDIKACHEILNAGISLLATAHGSGYADLLKRPQLRKLILENFFEKYIILNRLKGPGNIENILDAQGKSIFRGGYKC